MSDLVIHTSSRPELVERAGVAASQWLSLRLQLIAAILVTSIAFLAVSSRHSYDSRWGKRRSRARTNSALLAMYVIRIIMCCYVEQLNRCWCVQHRCWSVYLDGFVQGHNILNKGLKTNYWTETILASFWKNVACQVMECSVGTGWTA